MQCYNNQQPFPKEYLSLHTYQQKGKIHHSGPSHPAASAGPFSVLAAGTMHTPGPQVGLSQGPAERCHPLVIVLTAVVTAGTSLTNKLPKMFF